MSKQESLNNYSETTSKEAVSIAAWRLTKFFSNYLLEENKVVKRLRPEDKLVLAALADVMNKTSYTTRSQKNIRLNGSKIEELQTYPLQSSHVFNDFPTDLQYTDADVSLEYMYYPTDMPSAVYKYNVDFETPLGKMNLPFGFVKKISIDINTMLPSLEVFSYEDVVYFHLDHKLRREGMNTEFAYKTIYLLPSGVRTAKITSFFLNKFVHQVYKTDPIDIENAIKREIPFKLFAEQPSRIKKNTIAHREFDFVPMGLVDIPKMRKFKAFYNSSNDDVIYERDA